MTLCPVLFTGQSTFSFVLPTFAFRSFVPPQFAFDSTLGFPGEGPDDLWCVATANVGSLVSNPSAYGWNVDVACLQEVRLAAQNLQNAQTEAHDHSKHIFHGKLLVPKINAKGDCKVPHGGVAVLANQAKTENFAPSQDDLELWTRIHDTHRVVFVWHQVAPKIKILVISVYLHSGINPTNHDLNNGILQDIFQFTAGMGDIPIILCGDLQQEPQKYEAYQTLNVNQEWFDPMASWDEEGDLHRPVTYARNSKFDHQAEHDSSLDAILVNHVALTALSRIEVRYTEARQHTPVLAWFNWPEIYSKGEVIVRPAPLILGDIPQKDGSPDHAYIARCAENLWSEERAAKCSAACSETAWAAINDFAVDTLLAAGIVEVPHSVVKNRLQCSKLEQLKPVSWDHDLKPIEFWTDGSVIEAQSFWHTKGAFACVDDAGNLCSGPVYHLALTSYTSEFWAILKAFAMASGPCRIYTDCQTLVDPFHSLVHSRVVDPGWNHHSWWCWLWELIQKRLCFHTHPLELEWIPAHKSDNISVDRITDEFARSVGTSKRNIINNRLVDGLAKTCARNQLNENIFEQEQVQCEQEQVQWHVWLAQLAAALPQETTEEPEAPPEPEFDTVVDSASPPEAFRHKLPRAARALSASESPDFVRQVHGGTREDLLCRGRLSQRRWRGTSTVGDLVHGLACLQQFISLWGLDTDFKKSYCWALDLTQRRQLAQLPFLAVDQVRELGGTLSFTRRPYTGAFKVRAVALTSRWDRLKRSGAPLFQKFMSLASVFWPIVSGCKL
eukprot:Skav207042  [mRNA]  locus=scaffold975:323416:330901:- [translate_table: standard]